MAAITISAPAGRGPVSRRPAGSPAPQSVPAAVPPTQLRRSTTTSGSLRLTRRGRRLVRTAVVTVALLVALVTAVVAGVGVGSSQAGDGAAVPATATVVVQPGQTLWSVARSVAPGADVRETVARIKDLNGLSGAAADVVRPGQQLVVPARG
jgi:LysM repeat protein